MRKEVDTVGCRGDIYLARLGNGRAVCLNKLLHHCAFVSFSLNDDLLAIALGNKVRTLIPVAGVPQTSSELKAQDRLSGGFHIRAPLQGHPQTVAGP